MEEFEYWDDERVVIEANDYVVRVPIGTERPKELFQQISSSGKFPAVCDNWNALLDYLRDWTWTGMKRVVIVHKDVPLRADRANLSQYVLALREAKRFWEDGGEKRLGSV